MLPSVTTPLCCSGDRSRLPGVPLRRQLYRLINIFLTSVTTPLHTHVHTHTHISTHTCVRIHTHMHCVCDTFTGNNNNTVRKHFDFERSRMRCARVFERVMSDTLTAAPLVMAARRMHACNFRMCRCCWVLFAMRACVRSRSGRVIDARNTLTG